MDWLDLLVVQGTLKSLFQHHSSKAAILWHSAFFTVQLSHPYMTTGKNIALTRRTFVGKVMSLFFNMLSRLKLYYIEDNVIKVWLQSLSFNLTLNKITDLCVSLVLTLGSEWDNIYDVYFQVSQVTALPSRSCAPVWDSETEARKMPHVRRASRSCRNPW